MTSFKEGYEKSHCLVQAVLSFFRLFYGPDVVQDRAWSGTQHLRLQKDTVMICERERANHNGIWRWLCRSPRLIAQPPPQAQVLCNAGASVV